MKALFFKRPFPEPALGYSQLGFVGMRFPVFRATDFRIPLMKRSCHFSNAEKMQMKKLYEAGKSLSQISEIMNRSLCGLHYRFKILGVQMRPSSAKGRKYPNRIGHEHSELSRRKMSEIAKQRGPTHNFYVDGQGRKRDTLRQQEMDHLEYRLWREAVFKKNDYTCRICGERGGKLNADHLKRWKDHPTLRYALENGRTVCESCH